MSLHFDVIILGAGINGVATAKELAKRGKSVCVIDKNTIGFGASSRSSRLIHGGLRYLEHMEFSLVKEALKDQSYLLKNYPDLVKLHPFILPHYSSSKRLSWMVKLGLFLYRFFSSHNAQKAYITKESFLKDFSAFKDENLEAVHAYHDCQTKDLLLTQTIANEAKELGVVFKEHHETSHLNFNEKEIKLKVNGEDYECDTLVNVTGAWIDEINTKFRLPSRYNIEKISGIHLFLEGLLIPEPILLETSSQRIIFVLPQHDDNETLIGTTEHVEIGQTDNIMVNEADISYLLREINVYLNKPINRDDIKYSTIGVRPIIKTRKDPSKMSREYKFDLHKKGDKKLLHIYGGKLTTFHSLSLKASKLLTKGSS